MLVLIMLHIVFSLHSGLLEASEILAQKLILYEKVHTELRHFLVSRVRQQKNSKDLSKAHMQSAPSKHAEHLHTYVCFQLQI